MGYSCTSLGSVKRLGQFEWYIFLLQDGLSDPLRSEIENNFDQLGRSVGRRGCGDSWLRPPAFPTGSAGGLRQDRGSVADFLSSMVDALGNPDALVALAPNEPGRFERRWNWLRRYLTLQPAFMGFGVNADRLADDVAQTLDRWFPADAS